MESYLLQLKSIPDSWMSPCSVSMVMDMMFGVMCGVGLFFLLIPFLKNYPVSPPPESVKNTPKGVRRGRSKTRKHTASVKGCRDDRKNVEETQNASQPVKSSIKQPVLDSGSPPFLKSNEKLDHFSLSQLLSYLRVLEKFSWIFWGISSVLSESVVATAWVSKRRSSSEPKTVRFSDTCDTFPARPLAQEPPQTFQAQPLPYQFVTPSLAGVTEAQTLNNLPISAPNQRPSSSRATAYGTMHHTTEMKTLASFRTENQSWQQDLEWKDTLCSNVQKCQTAICQPTHLPRATPPTETIRPASTFLEHSQFLQHHEELQRGHRMTKRREQQGAPSGVLPSQERTQLQAHFPANSPCWSKNQPGLPQPGQPFILDSKSCKLSQMKGSVPSGMPLKKGPAKHDIQDPTKEGLSFRAEDLPCTSSSSPEKGLEARNPALRTDQRSYVNTTQELSFLDPQTLMKLESNIMQLPLKRRRRLQTLESRNLTPSGVPSPSLPQPVYPSSKACASKAEYYSKAAMILEKLHHRDPGGTRVETVSAARLQSPLFANSPSEVQVMQTATPAAVSHRPSKAHPDTQKSYLSTQTRAFCFQAKTQQSRTIQGTGRGSPPPRTSSRMPKLEAWKMFENMASGHPCSSRPMPSSQKPVPSSVVKQANRSEEKQEAPPGWKVTLGSTEIPNGQAINIHLRNFESVVSSRSQGHVQTITPQYSGASALKPYVYSETDFRSNKQPQALSVGHRPGSPSSVSLPSEHLLASFQNIPQNPMTSQGLDDVFMRKDHCQETQKLRVPKDTGQAKNHKVFYHNGQRKEFMKLRASCQEEKAGRGRPPTLSPTQFKDTAMGGFQPSLDMPGKRQSPQENYLKKIMRIILQYLNLNTKDKEEEDSLKKENFPPATVMTLGSDTTEKLIYNMATEMQSLMNVVVQILVKWLGVNVGDPSDSQWCKVEPLISQLRGFCHFPEGPHDSKNSRPEKTMSSSHSRPEGHGRPFLYEGIRDKYQRVCGQHQNRVKRGMSINQPPTFKGNNHSCRCMGIGDKQQSDVVTQKAYDPGQIRMKSGMDCSPHISPKEHNNLVMHRDVGDKWQPGIKYKACDPHQSKMKGLGYGHLPSSKENSYPVMYRGTGDKEQSYAAAWKAGHSKWTSPAKFKEQVPQTTLAFEHHEISQKMSHLPNHCSPMLSW